MNSSTFRNSLCFAILFAIAAPTSAFAYKKDEKKRNDKRIEVVQDEIDAKTKKLNELLDEENKLLLKRDSTDAEEIASLGKAYNGECKCEACPLPAQKMINAIEYCTQLLESESYPKFTEPCKKSMDSCGAVVLRKRLIQIEKEKTQIEAQIKEFEDRVQKMQEKFADENCEDCIIRWGTWRTTW